MAACLVKSMSRLTLSKQAGSSLKGIQTRSLASWWSNSHDHHASLLPSLTMKPIPTSLQYPGNNSRILQNLSVGNAPVRTVTYEIKQWREHRVINRFYRLHWGAWIRCRGGRHKKLYRKSPKVRWLLKQHIFCNKTQSTLLDRLVTPQWREPKHFVDSPYEPYHQRTNFPEFPRRRKFYP